MKIIWRLHTQNLDRDLTDINRFESENQELEAKKIKISEDIILLQQAIEELQRKKEALSVVLNEETAKKEEMSRRLNSLRNGIRGIEDEIIRIKTDMHNQQMRQQEVQFNQRALKERLLQAYKIDWDASRNQLLPTRGQPSEGTCPHAGCQAEEALNVKAPRENHCHRLNIEELT